LKTIDFYIEFNISTTSIDDVFKHIHTLYGNGKIINYTFKPHSHNNSSLKIISGKIEVIEGEKMI